MLRPIFAASIAAAALIPSAAYAQSNCERHRSDNRVVGTVGGAVVGGVLGNVVAGQGDKTLGTVVGGYLDEVGDLRKRDVPAVVRPDHLPVTGVDEVGEACLLMPIGIGGPQLPIQVLDPLGLLALL